MRTRSKLRKTHETEYFIPLVGPIDPKTMLNQWISFVVTIQMENDDENLGKVRYELVKRLKGSGRDTLVLNRFGTKIIVLTKQPDFLKLLEEGVEVTINDKRIRIPLSIEKRSLTEIELFHVMSSIIENTLSKQFDKKGRKLLLNDSSSEEVIYLKDDLKLIVRRGIRLEWFIRKDNEMILGLKEVYDLSITPSLDVLLKIAHFKNYDLNSFKGLEVNTIDKYVNGGFGPRYAGKIEKIITKNDPEYEHHLEEVLEYYRKKFVTNPEKHDQLLELARIKENKDTFNAPIIVVKKYYQGKIQENTYLSTILTLTPSTTTLSTILDVFFDDSDGDSRKKIETRIQETIFPSTKEYYERMMQWLSILNELLSENPSLGLKLSFLTVDGLKKGRSGDYGKSIVFLESIELPNLCFGNDKTHRIPQKGMKKFGPWGRLPDRRTNIYIIGSDKLCRESKRFKERLESELKELNFFDKVFFKEHYYDSEIDKNLNKRRYLKEAGKLVERARKAEYPNKVIVQVLPRSDSSDDSFYSLIRQRALASRGQVADSPIPVQSIEQGKLKKNFIYFNLAIAIYSKLGGVPWKLKEPCSKLFPNAIYIGYDISRRPGKNDMFATIVVQDNHGEIIHHTNIPIQTPQGKDIIPRDEFVKLIRHLVQDIQADKKEVEVIVIHRDGEFSREELEAMKELEQEDGLRFIGIAISKSSGLPLLEIENGRPSDKVARSGFYIHVGKQLTMGGKIEDTFLLNTYGGEIPGGNVMPRLLKLRLSHVSETLLKNSESITFQEITNDCIRQVLYLTRLNWAVKFGVSKLPVTIHLAHKASKILSLGINADLKREQLWML